MSMMSRMIGRCKPEIISKVYEIWPNIYDADVYMQNGCYKIIIKNMNSRQLVTLSIMENIADFFGNRNISFETGTINISIDIEGKPNVVYFTEITIG